MGELRGFENFKIELKNKIKNNCKNRHFTITFCIDSKSCIRHTILSTPCHPNADQHPKQFMLKPMLPNLERWIVQGLKLLRQKCSHKTLVLHIERIGNLWVEKIFLTNRTLYLVAVIVVELNPLIKRGIYNLEQLSVVGVILQFKRLGKVPTSSCFPFNNCIFITFPVSGPCFGTMSGQRQVVCVFSYKLLCWQRIADHHEVVSVKYLVDDHKYLGLPCLPLHRVPYWFCFFHLYALLHFLLSTYQL